MTITRIFVLLSIFSAWPVLSSEEPRLNVAVIAYSQETCTFCPGGDSEIKDRTWRAPYVPGHALTERREGFVGGFMHAANEYADVAVVGINSPDSVYGGSSRSWESKESFEGDRGRSPPTQHCCIPRGRANIQASFVFIT